jgi:hypothetical protein
VVTVKTQNTYYSLTRTPNRVIVGNITVAASVMLGLNMTLQLLSGKNIQEAFDNSVPDTVKYLGASFAGLAMKSLPVISRLASSASQALWGSVFSVVAFTVFDISFRLFSGDSVGEVFTDPSFYVKTLSYLGLALTSYFLSGPVVAIVAVGVTLLLAFLPNSENNRIQKAHEEYALKSIDLDLQVAESILSPAFH